MHRYEWRRRIEQLDPVTEYHKIYRIMVAHEFPWDMNQAQTSGSRLAPVVKVDHDGMSW